MLVMLVQLENAPASIKVTLDGMVTLVSWFSRNALAPIWVTLSGMVMLVS